MEYYSNTAVNLMQAPIPTVSPSLMQWMILKIDYCRACLMPSYKLVCYADMLFISKLIYLDTPVATYVATKLIHRLHTHTFSCINYVYCVHKCS